MYLSNMPDYIKNGIQIDHPGPGFGARVEEQPDVEQPSRWPVRDAPVLCLPGRLPLLLRHTRSVPHNSTHRFVFNRAGRSSVRLVLKQ